MGRAMGENEDKKEKKKSNKVPKTIIISYDPILGLKETELTFDEISANINVAKRQFDELTTSTASISAYVGNFLERFEQLEAKDKITNKERSELKLDIQSIRKEFKEWKQKQNAFSEAFEVLLPIVEVVKQMDLEEFAEKTPYALVYHQKITKLEEDVDEIKETAERAENIALDVRMIIIGFTAIAFIMGIFFTYIFPLIFPP